MRRIGKLVGYLILAINCLFAGLFVFAAYSPYINPEVHPILSCAGLAFFPLLLINIFFLFFWTFVYRKFVFFPLLTLLICFGSIRDYMAFSFHTKEIPENTFKLLSYNVMAFDGSKKHTKENPNAIIEYINEVDADVVCLQEFVMGIDKWHLSRKEINKALRAYPYRTYHKIGSMDNGLACYSKFPILSARRIDYPSLYNGSAIYQLKINEDTVTVINNHLESNKLTFEDKSVYEDMIKSPGRKTVSHGLRLLISKLAEASAIRAKQAQLIAKTIEECKTTSIVVCADFNDIPVSYTHRMIAKDLNDAFTQSGQGLGISYNQNKFYFKIDNILLSKNLKSYNCTVDNVIKDSDHYPIWCYIGKKKQ
ncbi:MAG: endonuclease/exonuclease/phosphatase family protein [Bacteroides sp.]